MPSLESHQQSTVNFHPEETSGVLPIGMTGREYRRHGREMVDYIADYLEGLTRGKPDRVIPAVQPDYLKELVPATAPEEPENWADVMRDVEEKIKPGLLHWHHSHFFGYYPGRVSYPAILAEGLSAALGNNAFSWTAGPAATELEKIVVDWMAKMMHLPKDFLHYPEEGQSSRGTGGGVIQSSASDCVLNCYIAARHRAIKRYRAAHRVTEEQVGDGIILDKLRAYTSTEAHSCVEKGANVAMIKLTRIEPDETGSMSVETLKKAVEDDSAAGLIPAIVIGTFGTTGLCQLDDLAAIGRICRENEVWFHVDGAYGGSALICPEFRSLMDGIPEFADSFNVNPTKWLPINYDCALLYVRNRVSYCEAFEIAPLYLSHSFADHHPVRDVRY